MSYTKTFTKTISVHYSGSVSYPKSESGGTVHYSGTAHETVHVNIEVQTDPFDNSIDRCNSTVNTLTGAIVAAETAEVLSIKENANKLGQTITDGFFKTVKSEITQQITELESRVNALAIHMHELAKRCADKQRQMSEDYRRITSRYEKLFQDLNHELDTRIHALDKPAFDFTDHSSNTADRGVATDMITTASIASAEGSSLMAHIESARAKRQVMVTLGKAEQFLHVQKNVEQVLEHSLLDAPGNGQKYVPVCYIETVHTPSSHNHDIYPSDFLPQSHRNNIIQQPASLNWTGKVNDNDAEQVQMYYNYRVSEMDHDNRHDERVRECMSKLFNLSDTHTPNE